MAALTETCHGAAEPAGPACAPVTAGVAPPPTPPAASVRRTVARNVLSNWAGTAVTMMAGFVVLPFLVQRLGQEGYGLWILVGSLTGYFAVLDLGVRGSVGRNLAFHLAQNDYEGAGAVLSTGFVLLTGAALLALAGTLATVALFPYLFTAVPAAQIGAARLALALIGLHLVLFFLGSVFEAVLWGYQRFDLINGVDIPAVILRTALTFALVGAGGGLVALAAITVSVTGLSGSAKLLLALRLDPKLRFRAGLVRRRAAVGLVGFGIWCVLVALARVAVAPAGPLLCTLVGSRLAVATLTPFTIAARLVGYVSEILATGSGVLTPVATALHARDERRQQQTLLIQGGKYCLALALFFLGLFIFLGQPLIALWIGRPLPGAFAALVILGLGEVLPQSQWVTFSTVLGMNRHRLWAGLGWVEVGCVVGLAVILLPPYGLTGAALAVALPGTLCRGVAPMILACRMLGVPLWQYVRKALLAPVAVAVLPLGGLALLTTWSVPAGWLPMLVYVALYSLTFAVVGAVVLIGLQPLRAHASALVACARSRTRWAASDRGA